MTDPSPTADPARAAALADPYNYLLRRVVQHQEANRRQDDLLVLHPELWTEYVRQVIGNHGGALNWQANTVMGYKYAIATFTSLCCFIPQEYLR